MGPFEFLILVAAIAGIIVCLLPPIRRRRGAKVAAAALGLVALAVLIEAAVFRDDRPRLRVVNRSPGPIELEVRRGDERTPAGRVAAGSETTIRFGPPSKGVRIAFRRPGWAKPLEAEMTEGMAPGGPFGTSHTLVIGPDNFYTRGTLTILDPFLPVR